MCRNAFAIAGERVDPQRRRVPDDTSATVERAQLAMAEIDAWRVAEAAEQARVTDIPLDHEDDRREELISWTDDDTSHEAGTVRDTDTDEDVLGR